MVKPMTSVSAHTITANFSVLRYVFQVTKEDSVSM